MPSRLKIVPVARNLPYGSPLLNAILGTQPDTSFTVDSSYVLDMAYRLSTASMNYAIADPPITLVSCNTGA